MRVAGVLLGDSRRVWVDAGEHQFLPPDVVELHLGDSVVTGTVFVSPEQLAFERIESQGVVLAARQRQVSEVPPSLPGADMLPLGTHLSVDGVSGTVIQIDAVDRTVTVKGADGTKSVLAWPEARG